MKHDVELVAKEFNYTMNYGDNSEDVFTAVVVIPNGLKSPFGTIDAVIYAEDINGNEINFKSVEEAQNWIDKNKGNLEFHVEHGDEIHATPVSESVNENVHNKIIKFNSKKLHETKNSEYIEAVRQADYEANKILREYDNGDKSIADILIEMEYEQDDPDSVYFYKEVDGGNAIIFDFSKYDAGENYIKYFVVDENDKIKQGYTATKLIIDESLNESSNSYSRGNYYVIDFGNCWVAKDSYGNIVCKRETSDEVDDWIDEQSFDYDDEI